VQNTDEKPNAPLKLRVYAGQECTGSLYEDDGHTFAYQKGEFLRVNYSCQTSAGSLTVDSSIANPAFQPWWNTTEVTIFGAAAEPKEVRIRDQAIHEWRYDRKVHTVTLTVPEAAKNWSVQLLF
jgi:alpha-glucosidase